MTKFGTAGRVGLLKGIICASALAFSSTAVAQTVEKEAEPPADAPSPDDASILTVSEAEANASAADAKTALLEAQIAGLQAQLDDLKKALPKAVPTWKGAPQWDDKDAGFSFKVRGRLMLDAAYAGKPDNYLSVANTARNRNLGFNARVRRFRIGVEGSLPAGFGYKAEVDYANGAVGFGDVILTYAPANKPFSATLGNQESLDGMEQQTSSRWSSFIERAQGNDAFGNTRRLGMSFGYKSSDNFLRLDAGLFTAHSIDASVDNDGWIGAARVTYGAPAVGGFIHVGANYQHREFQSNNNGVASVSVGAPSTNQIARYRARPFLQTTDARFVDTGTFAASGDDIFGAEAYGIFKSLHLGGEWQYVKVKAYRPGDIRTGLDAFAGGTVVTPSSDPSFFSGHFEVGYFLTGETRGYKNGLWDRTKVLHPFDQGGWGAVQVIGRVDYLDLDTAKLKNARSNNFANGTSTLASFASRSTRGGTQMGYLLGVTWIPTDYVRFLFNYIHSEVEGGPFAGIANPTSTVSIDRRKYSTDSLAVRAQFDF
jgi:phosphate-selective porin OprO and OprP